MSDKKAKRAERRQRQILLYLVNSTAVSAEAVRRLADRFRVNEKSVLHDLEAMKTELEEPAEGLPEDLREAILAANTFHLLRLLGQRVMEGMRSGTITPELGRAFSVVLREQRHALEASRNEEGQIAIKALEILTPQEEEALKKYRESLTPPALKPGEFPAPPEGAQAPPTKAHGTMAGGAP